MNTKIVIVGAMGRMGITMTELCRKNNNLDIVGLIETSLNQYIGKKPYEELPEITDSLTHSVASCDVVIDFSTPTSTQQALDICLKHKKPIVIGTTGHTPVQAESIRKASQDIAVICAPNMSVGVNALFHIIQTAMNIFKDRDYEIEVIEAHHNKKKDAPSGTAKKILEIIKEHRPDSAFIYGREGDDIPRKKNEVGVFAIRAGDIVGEHSILFCAPGERIELKHIATSRTVLAQGALIAAGWLHNKKPGYYTMADVLGFLPQ